MFQKPNYQDEGRPLLRTTSEQYQYLFLFAILFGSGFLLLTTFSTGIFTYNNGPPVPSWYSRHHNNFVSDHGFTIKTEGCTIPAMKPLDETVKQYVHYPKDMNPCPNANHSFLLNNKTHIWVNKNESDYYNVTEPNEVVCEYKPFYRPDHVDNIMAFSVDDRLQQNDIKIFNDTIEIKDEFFRAVCTFKGNIVYDNFFATALKKDIILHDNVKEVPKNKSAYNVLILGIDALSRLNFHRTMPRTLSFIQKKGAVELLGYNKIGDNSYPNLVAMLMGYKENELKKICHPFTSTSFDFCPLIWHWYKQAGYYTAFGEDSSSLGTFNYLLKGFVTTPTDYYLHPFVHFSERAVGVNKDFNVQLCMGEKFYFKVLLDYVEDVITTVRSSKLFAFFWEITMSHDYLNYPMVMDDSYEKFFKRLDDTKYLEETIIFIVSDHGIRWGPIRSTMQGRLEERLPLVYILTPQSFRDSYSDAFNNLKINSKRLTTPLDVHQTLVDLINLDNLKNEQILSRMKEPYAIKRSMSLFLQVPTNRTCKSAGIDDHWCTCYNSQNIAANSTKAMDAANHLVERLNFLIKEHTQCMKLNLAEVKEVREMTVGEARDDEAGWQEYMVVLRTTPGDGVFEATLRYDSRNWTVSGTASRLNLYGDQSHCVHNPHLKLYCYCG